MTDHLKRQVTGRRQGESARPLEDARSIWDDLVVPERERAKLRFLVLQARECLAQEPGSAVNSSRHRKGLAVLFSGPSGTGKTMAAQILAKVLRLGLYRVDLAAVVSKYIGETEKNLTRVLEAAESRDVVLLFDEADALFGKRSEVRDSHDRYANIETSHLLQLLEKYRGVVILTSNQKENIDPVFVRRMRVVVEFPMPKKRTRG